jgi:hypothetical protein
MSQHLQRSILGAVLALAASLTPSVAAADDAVRLSLDWDKLAVLLHEGPASLLPRETGLSGLGGHAETVDQAHGGVPSTWIGMSPRLALVARDWGVTQVLWGHLAVTDQFRLSRSSRMVVTRLRLVDGRLSPFLHVGVGQWRADTSVVASLSSDVVLAGQLGGGFELEVAPRTVIALQADCTMLYREGRGDGQTLASGQLWGTLLAARARF